MHGNSTVLRVGDLIYIRTLPRARPREGGEEGETRAAVVMVSGWERGFARLRLVQDFGRPEDASRWAGAQPVMTLMREDQTQLFCHPSPSYRLVEPPGCPDVGREGPRANGLGF
jgi:hypothetical protein